MTLRIEFSPQDLTKITISRTPDPLWETLLALHLVNAKATSVAFRRWCGATQLSGAAKQLLLLAPAQGYSPDFLTPAEGAAGLDAGLDAVLTTPRARLRTEMGKLGAGHRLGPWARDVADGRSPGHAEPVRRDPGIPPRRPGTPLVIHHFPSEQ
ncbi:hypothetical protein [Fodinicola feengrottensis]|uniref:hypothetical protein n=1 Tax=Fodinicola feengrottensis TaxID=435914 RepID=UPI002441E682|nr:hypothetical protein [Fodinicola feengrottensis]